MKLYVTIGNDNAKIHDSLIDVVNSYDITNNSTAITDKQVAARLKDQGIEIFEGNLEVKRYGLICVGDNSFEEDSVGNPVFMDAETLLREILMRIDKLREEAQGEVKDLHVLGLIKENLYRFTIENKGSIFTEFLSFPHVISKKKLNSGMSVICSIVGKEYDYFSLLPMIFPTMGIVSSDKDIFALTDIRIQNDIKSDKFEDPKKFYKNITEEESFFREVLRTAKKTGAIEDDTISVLSGKTEMLLGLKIYTLNI